METNQMKADQIQWPPSSHISPCSFEDLGSPPPSDRWAPALRGNARGLSADNLPFIICCSSICKVWMALEGSSLAERLIRWMESFPSATAAMSSSSKKMTRLVCSMMALEGGGKKTSEFTFHPSKLQGGSHFLLLRHGIPYHLAGRWHYSKKIPRQALPYSTRLSPINYFEL